MVEWMSYPLYYAFDGAAPPPRAGAAHATIYPYGPFPAGDGKIVMLGLQNEREWAVFCERRARAARRSPTDPRFAVERARARQRATRCARSSSTRSRPLSAEQVDRAPRRGADRQRAHERHARRLGASAARGARALGRGRHARGRGAGAAAAGRCRRRTSRAWTRCPRSAQHTDAILRELGIGEDAIARLRTENAI